MSMRSVYRKVAKAHGVSVEEVRREMQSALTEAYRHPARDGVTSAYQGQIPFQGQAPTPEEAIRFAVRKVRRR